MLNIRKAKIEDIKDITKIYNYAILKTNATFDTKEKSIEEQKKWFKQHGKKNPIIVAELDNIIIGFASLNKYSSKLAYSDTVEISLYLLEEYHNKGYGKKLMDSIIKEGRKAGVHVILSRITEGNEKSIYLHESVGFELVGVMREVGFKFGKRLNVYLMQKIFSI